MIQNNLSTSRQSILLSNCRSHLTSSLHKFHANLHSTLKRESLKKSIAIQDARTNFSFLQKIKNDLKQKLQKQKIQREFPIQKLKDQFKDMTDFRGKYEEKCGELEARIRGERGRREGLLRVWRGVKRKVHERMSGGGRGEGDLLKSAVLEYTVHHENRVREMAKLQRMILEQVNRQKGLEKEYEGKREEVARAKRIAESLNSRICEETVHKRVEEVLREIAENWKVLEEVRRLLGGIDTQMKG